MSRQRSAPTFGDERLPARFWSKVRVNAQSGCWEWTAGRAADGYGSFGWKRGSVLAHRLAYEVLVGPIPDGLECDHTCRVRHCVNPGHVEPVTHHENTRRGEAGQYNATKTHCPQGHAYDERNTRRDRHGKRKCHACQRAACRRHRARRREAESEQRAC